MNSWKCCGCATSHCNIWTYTLQRCHPSSLLSRHPLHLCSCDISWSDTWRFRFLFSSIHESYIFVAESFNDWQVASLIATMSMYLNLWRFAMSSIHDHCQWIHFNTFYISAFFLDLSQRVAHSCRCVCLQWDGELYVCGHTLWIAASGVSTTMQVQEGGDVRSRMRWTCERQRCFCQIIAFIWALRAFSFVWTDAFKKRPASCVAVCTYHS